MESYEETFYEKHLTAISAAVIAIIVGVGAWQAFASFTQQVTAALR